MSTRLLNVCLGWEDEWPRRMGHDTLSGWCILQWLMLSQLLQGVTFPHESQETEREGFGSEDCKVGVVATGLLRHLVS